MVERSFRIRKARGSIPLISILEKRREREIEDRKEKRKKERGRRFIFIHIDYFTINKGFLIFLIVDKIIFN